jgi:hypothetical protein
VTGKAAFTEEEWQAVLEGPPVAGMLVITAEAGGSFRESFALAKAYAEARQQHGESELLDEIVAAKPEFGFGSAEPNHLRLQRLRDAVTTLQAKATPDEVEGYRNFVLALAKRVAAAHKEGDERISRSEQAALDEIAASLGASSAQ